MSDLVQYMDRLQHQSAKPHLLEFLKIVFKQWVALVTGSVTLLLVGLFLQDILKPTAIGVAVLWFLYVCYHAWVEERKRVNDLDVKLDASMPKIHIDNRGHRASEQRGSEGGVEFVQAWCSWEINLRNLGADTTLHSWNGAVVVDGTTEELKPHLQRMQPGLSDEIHRLPHNENMELCLHFTSKQFTFEQLNSPGATWFLRFEDVYNTVYSAFTGPPPDYGKLGMQVLETDKK